MTSSIFFLFLLLCGMIAPLTPASLSFHECLPIPSGSRCPFCNLPPFMCGILRQRSLLPFLPLTVTQGIGLRKETLFIPPFLQFVPFPSQLLGKSPLAAHMRLSSSNLGLTLFSGTLLSVPELGSSDPLLANHCPA